MYSLGSRGFTVSGLIPRSSYILSAMAYGALLVGLLAVPASGLVAERVPESCLKRASCKGTFHYAPPSKPQAPGSGEVRLTDLVPQTAELSSQASIEQCISEWKTFDMKIGNNQNVKSTNEEDLKIFDRFFSGASGGTARTQGFFLEMGAFNGLAESNSLFFERCLGWTGLLVEGNPNQYRVMVENNTRPSAHKLNVAPSCASDDEEVQFVLGQTESGLVDMVGSNPAKEIANVHCGPLSLYLRDLGIAQVDFFSLDVEGAELLVLKTVDFSKVRIPVVMVESWNRDCKEDCPKREAVRELMLSNGYTLDTGLVPKSDVFYLVDGV